MSSDLQNSNAQEKLDIKLSAMADESMDCGFNNQPVADSFISHVPAFKFQQI